MKGYRSTRAVSVYSVVTLRSLLSRGLPPLPESEVNEAALKSTPGKEGSSAQPQANRQQAP